MGFNGVGNAKLFPSQTFTFDGFHWGDGEDRGAQYFSANPKTRHGHSLIMVDQRKTRDNLGRVTYGVTVKNNDPNFVVEFDFQGGGLGGGL